MPLGISYRANPNTYAAPYIDDAVYSPNSFLKHPTNLGTYTTQKPLAGVLLDNLSYVNTNNERVCVKLGDEGGDNHPDVTIFDNLQYGVKATDANFVVRNCSFQKPIGAGVGINADISGENLNYNNTIGGSFVNINKVEISTPDNTPRNCFYDMHCYKNRWG